MRLLLSMSVVCFEQLGVVGEDTSKRTWFLCGPCMSRGVKPALYHSSCCALLGAICVTTARGICNLTN